MVGVGMMEMLLVVFSSGGMLGSGLLGLPPGERDPALLNAAAADSVLYFEWAERGEPKPEEAGVDGLIADPEVKQFLSDARSAILKAIETETENGGPEEQILGSTVPYLVETAVGRSGSLSVRYDADVGPSGAVPEGAQMPVWLTALSGVRATLIVNGGDQGDEIAKKLTELLKIVPAEMRQGEGLEHVQFQLPMPGVSIELHRHKEYFILGVGQGTVDAAIAGLSGESKGLRENARFNEAAARVAMKRTSLVSWLDIKGVREAAAKALGPQGAMIEGMLTIVGAEKIDSYVGTSGIVEGQMTSRSFLRTGGKTNGLLALASGRGIKNADFEQVPGDADFVFALSLNLRNVLAAVKDIVGKADPNSAEMLSAMIVQLEEELGMKLEEDLFGAFGDVLMLHDSPGAGGVFASSLVASFEVRDATKAQAALEKIMGIVEQSMPGVGGNQFRRRGVTLEKKPFQGVDVYYINTIGDDDIPVAPAFCVTDKHLLMALHPQAIKAQLRFLKSRDANFAGRFGNDFSLPEGDVLKFSYFQSSELIRYLYAAAPYFGQIVFSEIQSEGGEIDIFSLPSARAVLPYVKDSTSFVVRTPEGILCEGRSALPLPIGTFGTMMPFMLFGVRAVAMPVLGGQAFEADVAPVAVEAVAPARAVARPAVRKRAVRVPAKRAVKPKRESKKAADPGAA